MDTNGGMLGFFGADAASTSVAGWEPHAIDRLIAEAIDKYGVDEAIDTKAQRSDIESTRNARKVPIVYLQDSSGRIFERLGTYDRKTDEITYSEDPSSLRHENLHRVDNTAPAYRGSTTSSNRNMGQVLHEMGYGTWANQEVYEKREELRKAYPRSSINEELVVHASQDDTLAWNPLKRIKKSFGRFNPAYGDSITMGDLRDIARSARLNAGGEEYLRGMYKVRPNPIR